MSTPFFQTAETRVVKPQFTVFAYLPSARVIRAIKSAYRSGLPQGDAARAPHSSTSPWGSPGPSAEIHIFSVTGEQLPKKNPGGVNPDFKTPKRQPIMDLKSILTPLKWVKFRNSSFSNWRPLVAWLTGIRDFRRVTLYAQPRKNQAARNRVFP